MKKRFFFFALSVFICVSLWLIPHSAARAEPRLAVLVYFDQLRGDYLTRWDALFGEDGFHRLEKEGAWFRNCHYPYADTFTAVGHASVATGCLPQTHGIIANEWYDRAAGAEIYCVDSERYERVPPLPARATAAGKRPPGVSPERLQAPTLADALKDATGGKGRVVALSWKDRSAVLPGGRRPDACCWFDIPRGEVVTSSYYGDRLPPWIAAFNRSGAINAWIDRDWTRMTPRLDYEKYSGPDNVAGEGTLVIGRTFPHPLGALHIKSAYCAALYNSPFGNDVLLDLACRAIEAEKLGRHDTPDLLCLSFSSNDAIGHCWGPDSQEVLDVTLRTDRIVARLLAYLDKQVGKGKYVLALTSDHGVCPLPETARKQGKDAGRVDPALLVKKAEVFLSTAFALPAKNQRWIEGSAGPWLYLNRALLAHRQLEQADVEKTLADWLKKQPIIQAAYTRSQLLAGVAEDDVIGQHVRRSFFAERSGDVRFVLKPYHILSKNLSGTTHGTPHSYDTHVPLLVYGPGVRPGVFREAVEPQAVAAILAKALGIKPPAKSTAEVPAKLFVEKSEPRP